MDSLQHGNYHSTSLCNTKVVISRMDCFHILSLSLLLPCWYSLTMLSSESRQTNQLCSISQCDSDSLLNEVCLSPFHFHRKMYVFSNIFYVLQIFCCFIMAYVTLFFSNQGFLCLYFFLFPVDCKSFTNTRVKFHCQTSCFMAWWLSCVDISRSIWMLSEVHKWELLPPWWSGHVVPLKNFLWNNIMA